MKLKFIFGLLLVLSVFIGKAQTPQQTPVHTPFVGTYENDETADLAVVSFDGEVLNVDGAHYSIENVDTYMPVNGVQATVYTGQCVKASIMRNDTVEYLRVEYLDVDKQVHFILLH